MKLKEIYNCSSIYLLRKYSSLPELPACDFVPKIYTGPAFEKQSDIRKHRLNPALHTYYSSPFAIHQGYKQWLFDLNGRRYLDMFGGICTVSVGHCHPKMVKALNEQIDTLGHVSNVYFHPKIHEYAERLTDKFPDNLKVVYFVNSGSEANDLAILMARAHTNRFPIVSLRNCYHGMTYQTMGLTSIQCYKSPVPQPAGFYNTTNPDVYKGLWGGSKCRDSLVQTTRTCNCSNECEATDKYIEQFKELILYALPKQNLAAFFAESIQGVGGTVQYPLGYIKKAQALVKENGGLFISDEVQTGFGRTGGHYWGFEMHGIKPDIVTLAKGIGNGFPLAAVVTTSEIANALERSAFFNTYGGNPLSCTAGIAVLDIIEEENLQENSKIVGTQLLLRLKDLREKYPTIGDVRGKGLMIGVELVEPGTTTSLAPTKFMKIWEDCRDAGLIIGKGGTCGNVLRIKPPMCISKEDADFTVDALDFVFRNNQ